MAEHRLTAVLHDRRRAMVAEARGRVLEIGVGSGSNRDDYRPGVVSSVVTGARVDEADFPAASFDTVIATLVFCSLPDPDRAAAAIARWLTPGGRLLFLEHVRGVGLLGLAQQAATPLWARPFAGCHLDRDTIATLRRAGLAVTDCERFEMPGGGPLLRTCVQGVARPRPLVLEDQP
jgi:SAM-dependent methyltransferase